MMSLRKILLCEEMIMDFDGRGEGMRRAFEKTEEERLEIKKKKPMERDMYFACMLSRV